VRGGLHANKYRKLQCSKVIVSTLTNYCLWCKCRRTAIQSSIGCKPVYHTLP
jgi:hypothetical protein